MPEQSMINDSIKVSKYAGFYRTPLGKSIVKEEAKIVTEAFAGCSVILSVGCGTGKIESLIRDALSGTLVICLDQSREMLAHVAEPGYIVLGDATELPVADEAIDAILFLTSLEFIDDCSTAVDEAARVLGKGGRALFVLLNFDSGYFKKKMLEEDSYIRRNIITTSRSTLDTYISKRFEVEWISYALEISDGLVNPTNDPAKASIRLIYTKKLT